MIFIVGSALLKGVASTASCNQVEMCDWADEDAFVTGGETPFLLFSPDFILPLSVSVAPGVQLPAVKELETGEHKEVKIDCTAPLQQALADYADNAAKPPSVTGKNYYVLVLHRIWV